MADKQKKIRQYTKKKGGLTITNELNLGRPPKYKRVVPRQRGH